MKKDLRQQFPNVFHQSPRVYQQVVTLSALAGLPMPPPPVPFAEAWIIRKVDGGAHDAAVHGDYFYQ